LERWKTSRRLGELFGVHSRPRWIETLLYIAVISFFLRFMEMSTKVREGRIVPTPGLVNLGGGEGQESTDSGYL